jgi:hypothetical protein
MKLVRITLGVVLALIGAFLLLEGLGVWLPFGGGSHFSNTMDLIVGPLAIVIAILGWISVALQSRKHNP